MTSVGTPGARGLRRQRGTDMVANTRRSRSALGAVAALTLTLGLGAVAGVVPRAGDATTVHVADARSFTIDENLAQPAETVAPPPTIPMTVPATTAPPRRRLRGHWGQRSLSGELEAPPAPATPPAPEPPVEPRQPAEPPPEVVVHIAPVPAPPPAPTTVPRRQPTSAEIDQAIAGLRPYVRSLLPINPTHAQVAELGDKICTAFDEGQTTAPPAQPGVKATGAQLVKKVPFATLLQGGDDYILRTGVALYCPGHAKICPGWVRKRRATASARPDLGDVDGVGCILAGVGVREGDDLRLAGGEDALHDGHEVTVGRVVRPQANTPSGRTRRVRRRSPSGS